MNTPTRFFSYAAGIALLAAFGMVIYHEQTALGAADAENSTLVNRQQQMEQLRTDNQQEESLRAANAQVEELKKSNQDLPKLRNEIRRYREQKAEVERLIEENKKLAGTPNPTKVSSDASLTDLPSLDVLKQAVQGYFDSMTQDETVNRWKDKGSLIETIEKIPGMDAGSLTLDETDTPPDQMELRIIVQPEGTIARFQLLLRENKWTIQASKIK